MKTKDLLNTDERILAPQLKTMKVKELERHAQKIVKALGSDDYAFILGDLIKRLPTLEGDSQQKFSAVKNIIRNNLCLASNESENEDHSLERLSSILMLIIRRKFEKIHQERE